MHAKINGDERHRNEKIETGMWTLKGSNITGRSERVNQSRGRRRKASKSGMYNVNNIVEESKIERECLTSTKKKDQYPWE